MALDFTVVFSVRQRFGDNLRDGKPPRPPGSEFDSEKELGLETGAPFVGLEKDFSFQCPSVDRSHVAILLFQSQGVSIRQNMEINGQPIFGGIPTSVDSDTKRIESGSEAQQVRNLLARWNGNIMLIHSGVLQENNILRIRAAEMTDGNVDDFVIDNVVVLFKARPRGPVLDPGTVIALSAAALVANIAAWGYILWKFGL